MKMEQWARQELQELIESAYADDPTRQRRDVVRIVADQVRAWREELGSYLREIGPEYVIEAEVACYNRKTRRRMALEDESGQDPIPGILPRYEVVREMRLNFYGPDARRMDKRLLDCSIDEVWAAVEYYARQREFMAKRQAYCLFIYNAMREAELSDGHTVADLYRLLEAS